MLKLFLNTVQREWYDSEGNALPDGHPQIPYCNTEKVLIQCCTNTPNDGTGGLDPDNEWTKDSSFGIAGVTALLSADDNFVRNLKGSLKNELPSGEVSSLIVTIAEATDGKVPDSGTVRILDSSGNSEPLEYTGRSIDGSDVTFTLASGSTAANTYPAETEVACPEALYMQAAMSVAESDPATGLFVFNITAYSKKLREKVDYADLKEVDVKGLELLIFTIDDEGIISTRGTFICDTFRIPLPMADPNPNPDLPDTARDGIATIVEALFALGFQVQFSIDGIDLWHNEQVDADKFYRFRATAAGETGEWSEAVALVVGPQGEQGIAGTDGTNGISAYQVWLDQGNAGTEADFIASLQGTDGINGISAYQVWLDQGNAGTEADFIASLQGEQGLQGLQGEQGLAGSDGVDGAAGADGTDAFVYVAYASDNAGTDFNLTPSDTLKYRAEIHSTTEIATPSASDFSGATWVKYMGDDGVNGTDGVDGTDGTNFTVDATGLLSEKSTYDAELEGFAFLATDTGDLFLKNSDTSGDWSSAIPFQGPAGSNGIDGADGSSAYQIWLDQGNSGTEADFIASLAGEQGEQGIAGTDGVDGDSAYQTWLDQGNSGTEADFIASLAGADGADAFVYVAYASDNAGTGFSLSPSDTLKYRAEIHKNYVIENPATPDFISATWVKYIGDNGADGTNGANAYMYVAYASSNTGADFSFTPTDTLKYRAEIHTQVELSPPQESDFGSATWVKYIGDDGTGGEGGSLDNWQNFYKAVDFPQDWKESVWTNVGSNRPTIDYDQLNVPVWRVDYATAEGIGIFFTDKLPSGATNLVVEITAQPQTPGATGTDMDWKADIVRYREGVVESSIETVTLGSTAFNAVGITQSSYSVAMSSLTNTIQAGDQLAIILYPNTAASSPKQTDWMVLSVNIGVS